MSAFDLKDAPVHRYQHLDWDSRRWDGFESRPGDIYICTCYKSGTTWMQVIAALLVFQGTDFPGPLNEISPWLDLVTDTREALHSRMARQAHRRILKTHTALDGLRWFPDARYLYVARDPRDVFVSMMNHQANTDVETERALAAEMGQSVTVTDLLANDIEKALAEWLSRGFFDWERDGYPYWSVFHHGETFWQHRQQDNILMLHYSQLKSDLGGQMRRISRFLDVDVDESLFPSLVKAATFESMKSKADQLVPDADSGMWKSNRKFFNQGVNGQWRAVFSEANIERLDRLCKSYPADFMAWLFNPPGVAGHV